jgi:hypothetical protein
MAIVEAFRLWRPYLAYVQSSVSVLTDHLNHRYLSTKPKLSWRQARWLEELSVFDFKIEYREGSRNPADGLSRRPDLQDPNEQSEAQRAPLATFLNKFRVNVVTSEAVGLAARLVRNQASIPSILPIPSVPLIPSIPFEGPATSLTHTVSAESLWRGRPDLRRLVDQGDRGSRGPHASIAGVSSRESNTPIPAENSTRSRASRSDSQVTVTSTLLPSLSEALYDAQQRDAFVANEEWKKWRGSRGTAGSLWTFEDDALLRYRGRVYAPNDPGLREELLKLFHDAPTAGHQGVSKTKKRLSQSFF